MPEPKLGFECAALVFDTTLVSVAFNTWNDKWLQRAAFRNIARQRRDEIDSWPSATEAFQGEPVSWLSLTLIAAWISIGLMPSYGSV